jgi:hypothetical protein
MFALSDDQLALVTTAAGSVPVEKRGVFLERVAARLRVLGFRFTDADLGVAIQAALTGLILRLLAAVSVMPTPPAMMLQAEHGEPGWGGPHRGKYARGATRLFPSGGCRPY